MDNTRSFAVSMKRWSRESAPWGLTAIGCCRAALRQGQASRGARRSLDRFGESDSVHEEKGRLNGPPLGVTNFANSLAWCVGRGKV